MRRGSGGRMGARMGGMGGMRGFWVWKWLIKFNLWTKYQDESFKNFNNFLYSYFVMSDLYPN
jgi:hypothetical protein